MKKNFLTILLVIATLSSLSYAWIKGQEASKMAFIASKKTREADVNIELARRREIEALAAQAKATELTQQLKQCQQ